MQLPSPTQALPCPLTLRPSLPCQHGHELQAGTRTHIPPRACTCRRRNALAHHTHAGTITHMPPETLASGYVSKAMDIYSLGVLL